MTDADHIESRQQFLRNKSPDIAVYDVDIAEAPEVIRLKQIGKDIAVSRFQIAQLVRVIDIDFQIQFVWRQNAYFP